MTASLSYDLQWVDFLIIGSGVAGLRAAVELAPRGSVVIINKGASLESTTGYAQGGVAAAIREDDSWESHLSDTLRTGKGLCRREAVEVLVREGPSRIRELVDWGGNFDREDGSFLFAREGAHSHARILHAGGDATGAEILRALSKKVDGFSTVRRLENCFSLELLVENGECLGAVLLREGARPVFMGARGVLLAAGGAGQVYSRTSNPPGATGDGMAMAYRAGAKLLDMEFVQFHPTVLSVPGAPALLLSEAMRGEGARLLNSAGERFMGRYHPDAELAPRDTATRAIHEEMVRAGSHPVFLDITHLKEAYLRRRFPTIFNTCLRYGLDLSKDRIPVSPGAHFMIGGVETDLHGASAVPGLFAAGEVASCGIHGANRLASNSLLEGLVFGARAGASLARREAGGAFGGAALERMARKFSERIDAGAASGSRSTQSGRRDLASLLWENVGIIRNEASLNKALAGMDRWAEARTGVTLLKDDAEFRNLLSVGQLIARSATLRRESRGVHFRSDFPEESAEWADRHILIQSTESI
jgi:L-aspartate oxidase